MAWDEEGNAPYSLGEGFVTAHSDKALQVEIRPHGRVWVPKTVIHDDSEVFEAAGAGATGELVVKAWWAEKQRYGR